MGVAYGHLHPHLLLVGESQSEKGDIRICGAGQAVHCVQHLQVR